jgi:hypothetical protein
MSCELIGFEGQGQFKNGGYYPTDAEWDKIEENKYVIVATTTYTYDNGEHRQETDAHIINTEAIEKISIFYDVEDDYSQNVTVFTKEDGHFFGKHREFPVKAMKDKGIKVTESYGY